MARRSRRDMYPDTPTFHFHNANPKGIITTDCVIRAISTATETPYADTLRELVELSIATGYYPSDKKLYEKYLERKGWVKHKQPRKPDGTKYTGSEFCERAKRSINYIAHIGGHHIVAIVGAKVYDHWNSTYGCIGNYWTKDGATEMPVDTSFIENKIRAAQTRQEFIKLAEEISPLREINREAFSAVVDLLLSEFKRRGFRFTKSFCPNGFYNL